MNDEHTVWYRKWRPRTFAEITGQEHVTRTLRNAVAGKRLAHAYLLCGPRGTGKTTTARVLAKAVNCANPADGEPCDRCESCVAVREGRALDLVEMDAASNRGIDDIRELRERVGYAASGGRYKVYLIDEVHELTQQAFDALLKTLEEPPAHVIFVLATTDAHKVPATIVSRCQRFDLTRARPADTVALLHQIAAAEGVEAQDGALEVVARAATGSFRDATSLLEQLVASYGQHLTTEQARAGLGLTGDGRALDLARLAIRGDLAGGLALIASVRDDGVDLRQFNREVIARLRSLLLLRAGVEAGDADAAERSALEALARDADIQAITRALKGFGGADFRADPQASLPLELALVEVSLRVETAEGSVPALVERPPTRHAPARERPEAAPAPQANAVPPVEVLSAPQAPPTQDAELLATLTARLESRDIPSGEPAAARPSVQPADAPAAVPAGDTTIGHADESDITPTAQPDPATENGADGLASLADVRGRYRAIYERMRAVSRLAASRLNGGDIIAVDGERMTFGLPHPVQVEKLAPGSNDHGVLGDAVAQVFGRRYAVHCIHKPDVEDRLRAQPTRRSHLLDEALKLGARPLGGQ